MSERRMRRKRYGFTLIELLVVISIIGMLVGILLPSMHQARIRAKNTQCLNRLRSLFVAHMTYHQDYGKFPNLNPDKVDEGTWQYSYLIHDDEEGFNYNFGPLVADGTSLTEVKILFCPLQEDPYHSYATQENPWPVLPLAPTRSGYTRRYHVSGKSFSDFRGAPAFLTDIWHLPKVVRSAHKTGINAVYIDGHAQWVPDIGGFLTDNELTKPFEVEDNGIIEDIWDEINAAGR